MSSTPTTLRSLWDDHAPYVLRSLRYLGVREADLDDAVQETFVIAHRKIRDLRTVDAPRGWLYAIAVNVARHARRARTTGSLDDEDPPHDPRDLGRQMQARHELLWLLDQLDEQKREVIVLYFLEQLTLREISEALGCPLQTVYSRLGAATKQLEEARTRMRETG
jgi:RNA polymerase sigma-70 factor (ECF subfamily)